MAKYYKIHFKKGDTIFLGIIKVLTPFSIIIFYIPFAGTIRPTVIDKIGLIESIKSRLHDHIYTFNSGVRARSASCRTLLAEGILLANMPFLFYI